MSGKPTFQGRLAELYFDKSILNNQRLDFTRRSSATIWRWYDNGGSGYDEGVEGKDPDYRYCESTLRRILFCLNKYKSLCDCFVNQVIIMLGNGRSAFSEFYYEYNDIPSNNSRNTKH